MDNIPTFISSFQIHQKRRVTWWDMGLATAFILGLLLSLQGGKALRARVPTKDMMIRGLNIRGSISDMSLSEKGIQYLPENAFTGFHNLTV